MYHIVVSLEEKYDKNVIHNNTFKEIFRMQIHYIYDDEAKSSKLHVTINSIREGSIIVDCHLQHTYYLDTIYPGPDVMKSIMEKELLQGHLGVFKASLANFVFELSEDIPRINVALISTLAILLISLICITIFVCLYCRKRKRNRIKSQKKSTTSNVVRVSNPMYSANCSTPDIRCHTESHSATRYPLSHSNSCATEESIYCEPKEMLPYSISDESDNEGDECNKLQNQSQNRKSIPLPPKPDNCIGYSGFLPPPYYPSRQPPKPPTRNDTCQHSYVNNEFVTGKSESEACYFMPISDEEELVKEVGDDSLQNMAFKMENIYLHPTVTAEKLTSIDDIELNYLQPKQVTEQQAESSDLDSMYAIRRQK